ncbi:MAG: carbohydrate ABC transporter permease [Clostridiales bacterium]|nr:carbohydrate ABC transporter permease [Clostridiales bacterium]
MTSIAKKQLRSHVSNHIKESTGRKVFRVVNVIVLTALALICLLPFINVIAISFSNSFYVDSNQVYFWPKGWTTSAYTYILTRASFWTSFRTSIIRVLLGGSLNLFFIILTAYPLSKSNDKLHFRNVYTWYFFITMLVSGGMIPNYLLIAKLGLRDTIWSLVLPGALPVFNLVLMLNFFRQVPTALEEAALIDGASHMRTLVQIYLPVSLPAIATITLFCIVSHWNAWFDGMIYITTPSRVPMQTYLRSILIDMNVADMSADDYELYAMLANRTVKCSQIIVATIPILCVYPFLQRYFVSGIVLGSVKG